MTKDISRWSKAARDQRSSDMNPTSPQYCKSRGLTPPTHSGSGGMMDEIQEMIELPIEEEVDKCDVCRQVAKIERAVSIMDSGIYVFKPDYVTKKICSSCDKVACAICGEKIASALARGFIGTRPSDKRYTPDGIEPYSWGHWQIDRSPAKNLLYYCPACFTKYGEAGLFNVVNERYLAQKASFDDDDWDDD